MVNIELVSMCPTMSYAKTMNNSLNFVLTVFCVFFFRFIHQFLLFFAVHLMSASLQRALGSLCRTFIAATVVGSFSTLAIISLGGFILPLCKVQFTTSIQMVANIISIALIPFLSL